MQPVAVQRAVPGLSSPPGHPILSRQGPSGWHRASPRAASPPAAGIWMGLGIHTARFGRRERRRKLPELFFFLLKRILKCSALKRKNDSAEAFTELRRCHCVWAKAELYRGCLRTGGFSPAMTYKMKTPAVVAGAIQGMPWQQLEGWAGCLGRSCSPRKLACCSAMAWGSTLSRLGQVCRRGCPVGSVSLASFGDP